MRKILEYFIPNEALVVSFPVLRRPRHGLSRQGLQWVTLPPYATSLQAYRRLLLNLKIIEVIEQNQLSKPNDLKFPSPYVWTGLLFQSLLKRSLQVKMRINWWNMHWNLSEVFIWYRLGPLCQTSAMIQHFLKI